MMRKVAMLLLAAALGVAFVPGTSGAHINCFNLQLPTPLVHCRTQDHFFIGVQDLGNCVGVTWDYNPLHTPDLVVTGPVCESH